MMLMMRASPVLEQRVELTLAQRQEVKNQIISLRVDLARELSDSKYKPEAGCPKCGKELTVPEIIKGFRDDPQDFTTACPRCGERFMAKAVNRSSVGRGEFTFFCALQTLDQLKGLEILDKPTLQSREPAIYYSAMMHYGSLNHAFRRINVLYQFEELPNWQEKVAGYLGRLPDTVIADVVGVGVRQVRQYRTKLRIARFSKASLLGSIGVY
jgi:ribosomal protein S27AE